MIYTNLDQLLDWKIQYLKSIYMEDYAFGISLIQCLLLIQEAACPNANVPLGST